MIRGGVGGHVQLRRTAAAKQNVVWRHKLWRCGAVRTLSFWWPRGSGARELWWRCGERQCRWGQMGTQTNETHRLHCSAGGQASNAVKATACSDGHSTDEQGAFMGGEMCIHRHTSSFMRKDGKNTCSRSGLIWNRSQLYNSNSTALQFWSATPPMPAIRVHCRFAEQSSSRRIHDHNMRHCTVGVRVSNILALGCANCLRLASARVVPVQRPVE